MRLPGSCRYDCEQSGAAINFSFYLNPDHIKLRIADLLSSRILLLLRHCGASRITQINRYQSANPQSAIRNPQFLSAVALAYPYVRAVVGFQAEPILS